MTRDETIVLFLECESKRKDALAFGKSKEEAHEAAKAHWNSWAEKLLAERKALEEAGRWQAGEPKNDDTRDWLERAKVDFSFMSFRCGAVDQAELHEVEAALEKEAIKASSTVKSFSLEGDAEFKGFCFPADADFRSAAFTGAANFESTTFSRDTYFASATFSNYAAFRIAAFGGNNYFNNATFRGGAHFDSATFSGYAGFWSAVFSHHTSFASATFGDYAGFGSATFSDVATFWNATFSRGASFRDVTFSRDTNFRSAAFSRDADFKNTAFSGNVIFKTATFNCTTDFGSTTFAGAADFMITSFSGTVGFESATFTGNAFFMSATFASTANFESATFRGTDFANATFASATSFTGARFLAEANFSEVKVERGFNMTGADFKRVPAFYQSDFKQAPDLDNVRFPLPGFWRGGKAELIAQYRAIRRMAIQGADYEREQVAFKGELRSRRGIVDRWHDAAFWFGMIYDALSDFGRSMMRPFYLWVLSVIAFATVYLWNAGSPASEWSTTCTGNHIPKMLKAINLSLANALPVIGSNRSDGAKEFYGCIPIDQPAWSQIIQNGQALWSAVLIFLFLLALRNQFRIK